MKEVLCLLALTITARCSPLMTQTNSLVISTTETTNLQADGQVKESSSNVPQIYEMNVHTNVSNRFAKTQITSKVRNFGKTAQEATFSVITPEQAYISGFIMEIDGKQYAAYVEEKKKAKETYDRAVAFGQSAGHVAVSARDSNRFTVSINIEPEHKAIFYLTYEELLARQHDKYEVVLNIHPGQPVEKLDVQVQISESRPLKFVKVLPLRSGNQISRKENENLNPDAKVERVNDTSALVQFDPIIEKQKKYASELGTDKDNGLAGQFVVQYDVERDPQGGEVLVDGGHFVHFFAPSDIPPLPKHVIFILDTSGSMMGTRIRQVVEAMKKILSQLKEEDIFNIVEFNFIAKVWNIEKSAVQYETPTKSNYYIDYDDVEESVFQNRTSQPIPPPYQATKENIENAKKVVDKLTANGGTNIDDALKIGLRLIKTNPEAGKQHQPIVIFLTDGEANIGESDGDKLTSTIHELNAGRCPIFSLSFGDGADRMFLQKLSIKNLGFARHIYEDSDASLQLEEFYTEISSPLLSNVSFKYVNNVTEVTRTQFPLLFRGKELVVAGLIDSAFTAPEVGGWGIHGPINLKPVVSPSVGSLERLWAYLTLKQILEKRDAVEDKTNATKQALDLALKYSFVSDVSSLVVVKPNATDAVDTEDASKVRPPGPPHLKSYGGYVGYPQLSSLGGSRIAFGPPQSAAFPAGGYSGASFSAHPSPVGIRSGQAGLSSYHILGSGAARPLSFVGAYDSLSVPEDADTSFSTTTYQPTIIATTETSRTWLDSILNGNGTITLTKGVYDIGLNKTIPAEGECPKTPSNNTVGKCTLIQECQIVHPLLVDLETYEKYYCDLQGYAGVCCPTDVTA